MNLPIPIFRNEINALGDFKGGVKVARDFAMISLNNSNPKSLEVSNSAQSRFYFYSEKSNHLRQWFLSDDDEKVLGGLFASFDELLSWSVEKEFVEPRSIGILAN